MKARKLTSPATYGFQIEVDQAFLSLEGIEDNVVAEFGPESSKFREKKQLWAYLMPNLAKYSPKSSSDFPQIQENFATHLEVKSYSRTEPISWLPLVFATCFIFSRQFCIPISIQDTVEHWGTRWNINYYGTVFAQKGLERTTAAAGTGSKPRFGGKRSKVASRNPCDPINSPLLVGVAGVFRGFGASLRGTLDRLRRINRT